MAALSTLDDDYYQNALRYNENDSNENILGTAIKINEFFEEENNDQQQQQEETIVDEESIPPPSSPESESDSDYPDDGGGLELLTVSEVLQLDRPQPVRVIGLVDVIRTRFDLVKQINLLCTNENCPIRDRRETRTLKVGMFSVYDLPFVFPDGREALDLFCRCSQCRQPRRVTAGQGRYQSARIIELRNVAKDVDRDNSTNNNNSNNTEDLDRLMVLVHGKHAQNIGFSEEVEMIGELQIMPSSVIEARRSTIGRNPGNMFAD